MVLVILKQLNMYSRTVKYFTNTFRCSLKGNASGMGVVLSVRSQGVQGGILAGSNFHPGGRARAFAGCEVNSEVPSSGNHLRTAALARGRGPCFPTPAKDFAGKELCRFGR